ncbi:M43 family zinc metalloprotease [Fluviicola taffensis]|uniref:M43 family zinc metalloprotease n=1 Tax=Fluviicola taffensis TaxID=191579 RepID=UPI003137B44D
MKKQFYSLLGISLLSATWSFGQQQERVLDKSNMREGEHVEYCTTHKKMNELRSNPQFAKEYAKEQQAFENLMLAKKGENGSTKAIVYTIPVVFHILHNGGNENISKDQILSALDILNRDYAMLNADTISIQAPFQSLKSKVDIQFVLATKAPNGACFSGITRTQNALTNDGSSGSAQINAIVAGNDVFNGQWPGNKYLNIYVCKEIGGAAGYTMLPSSFTATSMQNGIFILDTYTGAIGTSNVGSSRALTHEVGHWLNLDHVWGGNNNPGSAGCGGSDNVQDTPATQGSTVCNLTANTCSTDNAYWGFDQIDNVENYMDYSYCSKMFTIGQVNRMRTALTVSNTGRANVISAANLTAVGASTPLTLCTAKFSTPRTVICAGESITFTDESYNVATGWTWTFTGGSPASSTTQNPTITYNTPGTYAVQLQATDGTNNNTANIPSYITVLPAGGNIPFYESFEASMNLTSPNWFVYNSGGATAWAVTNTAAKTGTNSAKLDNFSQTNGQIDELISGPIDLSSITSGTGVTLSFRYAYRKKISSNTDLLKVFLTKDCGEVWDVRKTLTAATMSGTSTATSAWTPTAADWVTVHMTNVTSVYWNDNFRCKFQVTNGGGNNVYIDDINIYSGGPSENPVTAGLADLGTVANINLFPNPADNEVQISFSSQIANEINFYVTDLSGKRIQQYQINATEGNNLVYIATENLSAGTYLIQMVDGTSQRTLTFVKK